MLEPKTLTYVGLAAAVVWSSASCGDETEGAPGIVLGQFSQAYNEAVCQHLVACNWAVDVPTCLSILAPDPGVAQAVQSATNGKLTYDPAAARACVDTTATYACTGDALLPRPIRETCDKVFGGRRGEGEACHHASECQGLDAVCEGSCTDTCCQGVCRLGAGFAGIGEPCDMKPCDTTSYCKSEPGGVVCAARVGPGESCSDGPYACQVGYACDPNTATCFRQADPGAACNPMLAAQGCAGIAEYCDVDLAKCVPMPSVGEPCVTNALAQNFCSGGIAFCAPGLTCESWPKEGEPCPQDFCLGKNLTGTTPALTCSNGTCVRRPSAPICVTP